jgi:hypothetical protein
MDGPEYTPLTQTFAEIAQLQNTPAQEKLILVKAALKQAKEMDRAGSLVLQDKVFLNSGAIIESLDSIFSEEASRNYNYYGESVEAVQDARSVISVQAHQEAAFG